MNCILICSFSEHIFCLPVAVNCLGLDVIISVNYDGLYWCHMIEDNLNDIYTKCYPSGCIFRSNTVLPNVYKL